MAVVTTFVRAEDLAVVLALVSRVEYKTATEIEAMLALSAALDAPVEAARSALDDRAAPADAASCPTCGAAPGEPCRPVRGREVELTVWSGRHAARWRASAGGLDSPER